MAFNFADKMSGFSGRLTENAEDDIKKRLRFGEKQIGTGGEKAFEPRKGFKGIIDRIEHHAENKTLTKKARAAVGLKPLDMHKPASPEAEGGHMTFLNKFAPKVAERLAGATPDQIAAVSRDFIKSQIDSDPDSIFHVLGQEEAKNQINKNINILRGFNQ